MPTRKRRCWMVRRGRKCPPYAKSQPRHSLMWDLPWQGTKLKPWHRMRASCSGLARVHSAFPDKSGPTTAGVMAGHINRLCGFEGGLQRHSDTFSADTCVCSLIIYI